MRRARWDYGLRNYLATLETERLRHSAHFSLASRAKCIDGRHTQAVINVEQPIDCFFVVESRVAEDNNRALEFGQRLGFLDENCRNSKYSVNAKAEQSPILYESPYLAHGFTEKLG